VLAVVLNPKKCMCFLYKFLWIVSKSFSYLLMESKKKYYFENEGRIEIHVIVYTKDRV
jgi:hypothetical protein